MHAHLHRLLFLFSMTLSAAIGGALLLAPCLVEGSLSVGPWARLARLFAADVMIRRVAVVSAVGLWLCALLFFRAPRRHRTESPDGLAH